MIIEEKTFRFERENGITIIVEEQLKDNGKGQFWTDRVFVVKDGQKNETRLDRFSPEESAFYSIGFAKQIGAPLSQRFNVKDLFAPVFDYKREVRERDAAIKHKIDSEWNRQQEIMEL